MMSEVEEEFFNLVSALDKFVISIEHQVKKTIVDISADGSFLQRLDSLRDAIDSFNVIKWNSKDVAFNLCDYLRKIAQGVCDKVEASLNTGDIPDFIIRIPAFEPKISNMKMINVTELKVKCSDMFHHIVSDLNCCLDLFYSEAKDALPTESLSGFEALFEDRRRLLTSYRSFQTVVWTKVREWKEKVSLILEFIIRDIEQTLISIFKEKELEPKLKRLHLSNENTYVDFQSGIAFKHFNNRLEEVEHEVKDGDYTKWKQLGKLQLSNRPGVLFLKVKGSSNSGVYLGVTDNMLSTVKENILLKHHDMDIQTLVQKNSKNIYVSYKTSLGLTEAQKTFKMLKRKFA